MPTKPAAKGKPAKRGSQVAVKQNSFRVQSNLDFPFCDYELKGRPEHQKLLTRNTTKGAEAFSIRTALAREALSSSGEEMDGCKKSSQQGAIGGAAAASKAARRPCPCWRE
jgi:hypothetical protein